MSTCAEPLWPGGLLVVGVFIGFYIVLAIVAAYFWSKL